MHWTRRFLCLPALLAFAAIAARPFGYLFSKVYDDSFYYLQIAENVVTGHGSTLDGITQTNGYQPLWMALSIAIRAVVSDRWAFPLVLAALQILLASAGLVVLERSWRRTLGAPLSALAALALGATSYWAFVNLMESGLNLLFLALVGWLVMDRRHLVERRSDIPLVAAIFAGAIYARLDNVILVAAIGVSAVAAAASADDRRGTRVRDLALAGLATFGAVLPYLLFNVYSSSSSPGSSGGHFVPVSGYVKQLIAFAPGFEASPLDRLWNAIIHTGATLRENVWIYGSIWIAPVVIPWCLCAPRAGAGRAWLHAGALAGVLLQFLYYATTSLNGLEDWYVLPYAIASIYLIARIGKAVVHSLPATFTRVAGHDVATLLGLGMALWLFASCGIAELRVMRHADYDVREYASRLSAFGEQYPSATFAGWNAGFTSYALGGKVTNLDGVVSDADYVDTYLAKYRTIDFILEKRFDFVVDYDHYLGVETNRKARWAGMTDSAYRQLLDAYDLCARARMPWQQVVLVRKGFDCTLCDDRRPLRQSDLRW